MKTNVRILETLWHTAVKVPLNCILFFGIGLLLLGAAPANAQLSYGTGIGNFELGLNYATVPATELGGVSGYRSLSSGIVIPAQLQTYPGLFSYMDNPNAILNDAASFNKALSELFPKENVVDVMAYNKAVNAYNNLAGDLALALAGAKALPATTPVELLYKKNVLDVIAALIAELEKAAPRLHSLGQAIKKAI